MSVRTPDPDPEWTPEGSNIPPTPSQSSNPGWLSDVELAEIRRRLPLLYVEAVPVRVDGLGQVTEVRGSIGVGQCAGDEDLAGHDSGPGNEPRIMPQPRLWPAPHRAAHSCARNSSNLALLMAFS